MKRISNTQDIKEITMKPKAFTRCELGGDWYENNLEITIEVGEYYPDYTEVQREIMEKIDGKTMNIEDVVLTVFGMMTFFSPLNIKVRDIVTDCKTHMNVIVEK